MNNQNTKTNNNKFIAIAIVLLSIIAISSGFLATGTNFLNSRADDGKNVAPTSSNTTVQPAETPTAKASTTNPTLSAIKSTDVVIQGTAPASSAIELKDGTGSAITCKNAPIVTDATGKYNCQLNVPLTTNTIIYSTATEPGKNSSSPVNASVSEGVVAPVASTPAPVTSAFSPYNINGGLLQFNIPDALKNSLGKSQYNANLSVPNLGDWKLAPGAAIPGLAGMVPILASKDPSNYLSTFLSNQTPEANNKPTTRIVLDQAALDAASGIPGFRPVEVGGLSDLVRIPNLSTPDTSDWWYVPKSSIEAGGYKVTANDVTNVGTAEATMGFYKGNATTQITPVADETLPYSFILEGTPSSYGPSNAFALNAKATTPENVNYIDNLVRGSTFDNATNKFALPKINVPKAGFPTVGGTSGWDLWWILPFLLLFLLLAFLLWLLGKLFGWFGGKEDTSKYSSTYTGINNNYKKTNVQTPKYTAEKMDMPEKLKMAQIPEEPVYTAPKAKYTSPAAAAAVAASVATVATGVKAASVATGAKAFVSKSTTKDDFQVIEGIGPVIEKNLHDAGIMSYEDLANASEEELEAILAPTSNNFTVINTSTWSEQSTLAAKGQFSELKVLQDNIYKGVKGASSAESMKYTASGPHASIPSSKPTHSSSTSSSNTSANTTSNSTSSPKPVARHSMQKDDLKVVEGIGPVIEKNLHEAGILSYEDLASLSEAQIEEIIAPINNGFTVINCSTWAEQSALAAAGKFDELQKLKDILDKGIRR